VLFRSPQNPKTPSSLERKLEISSRSQKSIEKYSIIALVFVVRNETWLILLLDSLVVIQVVDILL